MAYKINLMTVFKMHIVFQRSYI